MTKEAGNIDAAAKIIAEFIGCDWDEAPSQGRAYPNLWTRDGLCVATQDDFRDYAQRVVAAASPPATAVAQDGVTDAIGMLDDAIEEAKHHDGFCEIGSTNLKVIKTGFDALLAENARLLQERDYYRGDVAALREELGEAEGMRDVALLANRDLAASLTKGETWTDTRQLALARAEADANLLREENARLQAYVEDWGSRLELSARCCRDAQAITARAEADANRLAEALQALINSAALLHQNAIGCAIKHQGLDIEREGQPGWLRDCGSDIYAARTILAEHVAALSAERKEGGQP